MKKVCTFLCLVLVIMAMNLRPAEASRWKKMGGGAIIGAIVGQVTGHSPVKGAVIGAAVGLAYDAATRGKNNDCRETSRRNRAIIDGQAPCPRQQGYLGDPPPTTYAPPPVYRQQSSTQQYLGDQDPRVAEAYDN